MDHVDFSSAEQVEARKVTVSALLSAWETEIRNPEEHRAHFHAAIAEAVERCLIKTHFAVSSTMVSFNIGVKHQDFTEIRELRADFVDKDSGARFSELLGHLIKLCEPDRELFRYSHD